jgi:hypothetical protein
LVTLRSVQAAAASGSADPAASTIHDGKFAFTGLVAGTYWVVAERDNFQGGGSETLTLRAGDQKTDLVVRITPFSAIAGRVRNAEGDGIPGVQVNAMVYHYTAQGRRLEPQDNTVTNDLGEYRVYGLAAGKYFLRAAPALGGLAPGPGETYLTVYYPSVTDPSGAAAVDLRAGQDMRGVDFTLPRVRGAAVRGHVVAPPGSPAPSFGGKVFVLAAATNAVTIDGVARANVDLEGRFEFQGLAPGAYTLTFQGGIGGKLYFALRRIQVGAGDLEGIDLTLVPPVDVNGVLRIEGNTSVRPSQLRAFMETPLMGNQADPKDEGTFTIRSLQPEVYRAFAGGPGDLYLKSVRCGTADVTESGVDLTSGGGCELAITMSANGGQIEGQVQDDKGQPVYGSVTVTLLAVGTRRDDLFKRTGADLSGHFKMTAIAPGSYRLYAWEQGVDINAVRYDPDYVKPFDGLGQSVQVSEGGRENVSLKVIGVAAGQ